MNKVPLFLIALLCSLTLKSVAQATIVGYAPQFCGKKFFLWKEEDFLSKKRAVIKDTIVNSKGIFRFTVAPGPIQKYFIGNNDLFGYLYVQDGGKYKIEFISEKSQDKTYNLREEIELTFIDLDSTDINYKILGYESWLDDILSQIHFEKNNDDELWSKITYLKYAILKDVQQDTSSFFRNYVWYSIAMNIDNLRYKGARSQKDNFETYFQNRPILYSNTSYCQYFESFFDQFVTRMQVEDASSFFQAVVDLNIAAQDQIIKKYSYTSDDPLRSLIALYILKQAAGANLIPKSIIISNLSLRNTSSPIETHRKLANNLLLKLSKLSVGDVFPFDRIKIKPTDGKYVYIHAFNTSNTQCIQELNALIKLKLRYGSTIEFLTVYVDKPLNSVTEKKAFESISWTKVGLKEDDPLWEQLGIFTFPYYLLIDKDFVLLASPALTPTPNGKYETIEKTFFELSKP